VLTIARIHGHMLLQMLFRQAFLMTLVHITCKMALEIIIIIIIIIIIMLETEGNQII
jgi:hypothetical protein